MRLTLDTTYLLPAIGVAIRGLPRDAAITLLQEGHEITISDITLFELAAKAGKLTAAGNLTAERASRGIRAIAHDERIDKTPIHHTPILSTAFKLRRLMNDYIDCTILSTAINQTETLVTEDDAIHDLNEQPKLQEILRTLNPEFKIKRMNEIL